MFREGHEGGAPMMGISVLIRGNTRAFSLSLPCKDTGKRQLSARGGKKGVRSHLAP